MASVPGHAPPQGRQFMTTLTCRECQFFSSEPGDLERALPGINILSSAYGSVRADTAICEHRGIFVTPALACPDFFGKR